MAETHQPNPSLQSLFHALDPISLLLSQNSNPNHPLPLRLTTTDTFFMERGPRYRAYADLRESKLRMKSLRQQHNDEPQLKQSPPKKHVKFSPNLRNSRKASSLLAQSVPDFSATLRKENRKPPTALDMTPPANNSSKVNVGVFTNSRGSKSASAGEKKGLAMPRKSYATVEELKGISLAAASAINGENRGGRIGRGPTTNNKTILGYRHL